MRKKKDKRKSTFHFDKVVVGNNLSAVAHSYYEGVPLVFSNLEEYYFFDKLEDGRKKSDVISELIFFASVAGLVPFSDNLDSYRVEEKDKRIKVYGKRPFTYNITYDEIIRYDKEEEKKGEIFEVIDWFNIYSGMKHDYDQIYTGDEFVQKLVFYQSVRSNAINEGYKDVISFSYLTKKQIEDVGYSEFYARLKTIEHMKEVGIKGTGNGFYYGKQRYHKIKAEWDRRIVRKLKKDSEDEILKKYSELKHPYLKKIRGFYDRIKRT